MSERLPTTTKQWSDGEWEELRRAERARRRAVGILCIPLLTVLAYGLIR